MSYCSRLTCSFIFVSVSHPNSSRLRAPVGKSSTLTVIHIHLHSIAIWDETLTNWLWGVTSVKNYNANRMVIGIPNLLLNYYSLFAPHLIIRCQHVSTDSRVSTNSRVSTDSRVSTNSRVTTDSRVSTDSRVTNSSLLFQFQYYNPLWLQCLQL